MSKLLENTFGPDWRAEMDQRASQVAGVAAEAVTKLVETSIDEWGAEWTTLQEPIKGIYLDRLERETLKKLASTLAFKAETFEWRRAA